MKVESGDSMKLFSIIFLSIYFANCAFAETPIVDWSKASNVPTNERALFLTQMCTAMQAANYVMMSNYVIEAEFCEERIYKPFKEIIFICKASRGKVFIHCLYPTRPWLKVYRDYEAIDNAIAYGQSFMMKYQDARTKQPDVDYLELLDKLTKHTRQEAETRARELVLTVGCMDISEWRCVSWSFSEGSWAFGFAPFFKQYKIAVANVTILLSDSEDLKLCVYNNTMLVPLPVYDRVPDVIDPSLARELADSYVKKYLKRQPPNAGGIPMLFWKGDHEVTAERTNKYMSVPDMVFCTNVLEVLRPNYYYTDKRVEDGRWITNSPRWSWTAEYHKTPNTNYVPFTPLPVWIYVDAITGEMLGGID